VRNPADGTVDPTYNVACGSAATPGLAKVLSSANPAIDYDISLALNPSQGKAFVFYTDGLAANPTPNMIACTISSSTPQPATYAISGTVTNGSAGPGLSGVTMTLSGVGTGSTTTAGSGNYSFTNLAAGNYIVTPSAPGYTFSPATWSGNISADVSNVNFTGSSLPTLLPDLTIVGLVVPGVVTRMTSFPASVTVKNIGSGDAGPFTVKVYFTTGNTVPPNGAGALATINFSGLAAGASQTYSWNLITAGAYHTQYNFIAVVNPPDSSGNRAVTESNYSNNTKSAPSQVL